jgi:hypothetical protein
LSISQPHFAHVQPPQSAWLNDFVRRTCGTGELHAGQFTDSGLMPHRFLVAVPNATNRMPRRTSEATTTNTTFITRSGIITLIRMSNSTKSAILPRMAFAYFIVLDQLCSTTDGQCLGSRVTGKLVSVPHKLGPNTVLESVHEIGQGFGKILGGRSVDA